MSKINDRAIKFLSKKTSKNKAFQEKFEVQKLLTSENITLKESESLKIFLSKYSMGKVDIDKIELDNIQLTKISEEIRSIQKQEVLLHGERISKAQNVLKNYKKGAFSYWLEMTYGNRRTPYNFFYYYSLYRLLHSNEKKLLQQMPPKIVYIIGGRRLEDKEKINFVKMNYNKSLKDLEKIILKKYSNTQKKDPTLGYLKTSLNFLKKASKSKNLPKDSLDSLKEIQLRLEQILKINHIS